MRKLALAMVAFAAASCLWNPAGASAQQKTDLRYRKETPLTHLGEETRTSVFNAKMQKIGVEIKYTDGRQRKEIFKPGVYGVVEAYEEATDGSHQVTYYSDVGQFISRRARDKDGRTRLIYNIDAYNSAREEHLAKGDEVHFFAVENAQLKRKCAFLFKGEIYENFEGELPKDLKDVKLVKSLRVAAAGPSLIRITSTFEAPPPQKGITGGFGVPGMFRPGPAVVVPPPAIRVYALRGT